MRPSKREYFFNICETVKTRSTCVRRQVGAIAVNASGAIIATGYNGAPKGAEHCVIETCLRQGVPSGTRHELCMAVHAEQNLICQAAEHGVSLKGCEVYCTTKPCSICLKLLINAGVSKVYYQGDYPDELSDNLLDRSKHPMVLIQLIHVPA